MNQKGQAMFEVLAAIGVITIVAIGLVKALSISLRNIRFSKEIGQAQNYGQEVSEWLIYQRDADWDNLQTRVGQTFCLNNLEVGWVNGECEAESFIAGTAYQREVVLEEISPNEEINCSVTVSWVSPRKPNWSDPEVFNLSLNLTKWK